MKLAAIVAMAIAACAVTLIAAKTAQTTTGRVPAELPRC